MPSPGAFLQSQGSICTWPWTGFPYGAPWATSEAARRGALAPAQAARHKLPPGAWRVPICVQQVGQYPQKTAPGFLVKFFSPRAGSCLCTSHYGPQCQGRLLENTWMLGQCLGWQGTGQDGPRLLQTPAHMHIHPLICVSILPSLS